MPRLRSVIRAGPHDRPRLRNDTAARIGSLAKNGARSGRLSANRARKPLTRRTQRGGSAVIVARRQRRQYSGAAPIKMPRTRRPAWAAARPTRGLTVRPAHLLWGHRLRVTRGLLTPTPTALGKSAWAHRSVHSRGSVRIPGEATAMSTSRRKKSSAPTKAAMAPMNRLAIKSEKFRSIMKPTKALAISRQT